MADETNERFWRALQRFILNAQEVRTNPITTDMELHYDVETGVVIAKRVDGAQTEDDGGSGGGSSYPP